MTTSDSGSSDRTSSDGASRLTWSTPASALIAATAGGVALASAAVVSADPAARLLVGSAAVLLVGLALFGWRQRPRLSVVPGSPARLVVRGLFGAVEYGAEEIVRARVARFRRLGRPVPNLELDVRHADTDRLLIFGRWDLGTHPEDVFDVLVAYGLVPHTVD